MPGDHALLTAIAALYDAAVNPTLWPSALRQLTETTGSQASSLWTLDGSGTPRLPTFIYVNFDDQSISDYVAGIAALDPTVRYLVAHPQRAIVHDGLLGDQRDRDSRAYNDWHERHIETRFRMVGQTRIADGIQAGVALHRTTTAGQFSATDVERFAVLHPHVERALTIAFRLGTGTTTQRFNDEWLNRSPSGIVLLDDQLRILVINESARRMIAADDGIRVGRRGIVLGRRGENARLRTLMTEAVARQTGPRVPRSVRASRPSGKTPYVVTVLPLPPDYEPLTLFRPAVCVIIGDPAAATAPAIQRLREAFGLTEAEARLVVLLVSGEDLRDAAAQLEITYGTARARLADVFQKTDTRRQAELLRVILSSVPL